MSALANTDRFRTNPDPTIQNPTPDEKAEYDAADARIHALSKDDKAKEFDLALERLNRAARPMTVATLRKILITLGSILTYAVRMRYIDFNPTR